MSRHQKGGVQIKVAIIGSRDSNACGLSYIRERIPEGCTAIISGGARGVDAMAELAAKEEKLPFEIILPDYSRYGRNAPRVRNISIVSRADMVLAFWDFKSRGTMHTIAECLRMRVPVRVYGI